MRGERASEEQQEGRKRRLLRAETHLDFFEALQLLVIAVILDPVRPSDSWNSRIDAMETVAASLRLNYYVYL